jgi:hypothetical protein
LLATIVRRFASSHDSRDSRILRALTAGSRFGLAPGQLAERPRAEGLTRFSGVVLAQNDWAIGPARESRC